MTQAPPMIMRGDAIIIVLDGESHTVDSAHKNYAKIQDAIREKRWDDLSDLVNMNVALANYSNGRVSIKDGQLLWDGQVFHNSLSDRILEMYGEGFPIDAMLAFMANLVENPSARAVKELYGFLEANDLPITPDGHFLAYKKVKKLASDKTLADGTVAKAGEFVDIHSGSIRNNPGDTPSMPRYTVDDDSSRDCSHGLHFAGLGYMPKFGNSSDGVIVILKINPRDVVSIPSAYTNTKGRCCRYHIVAVHGDNSYNDTSAFDKSVVDPTTMGDQNPASNDFGQQDAG